MLDTTALVGAIGGALSGVAAVVMAVLAIRRRPRVPEDPHE
ncbi:hypothetical protein [Streptomyces sp. HUAS ZL42]